MLVDALLHVMSDWLDYEVSPVVRAVTEARIVSHLNRWRVCVRAARVLIQHCLFGCGPLDAEALT